MEGYETAFEHRDPSIYFAGVRGGPRRYVDATYGTTYSDTTPDGRVFPGKEAMIPFAVFGNNMTEYYSNCRYVPISQVDYEREVVMYEGFRYSAEGFAAMTTTPNVHRVTDSRGFDLYVVDTGAGCTT